MIKDSDKNIVPDEAKSEETYDIVTGEPGLGFMYANNNGSHMHFDLQNTSAFLSWLATNFNASSPTFYVSETGFTMKVGALKTVVGPWGLYIPAGDVGSTEESAADENGFVIKGTSLYRYDESIGGPVVNIPEGVKRIKANAFSKCKGITQVYIPDSVTSIGDACFSGCKNLVTVRLPEGLTIIYDYMIDGCASLTEINLPNTVTSIGRECFEFCESLEEIVMPEALTVIGDRAFAGAKALKKITFNWALKKIGFAAFNVCPALTELNLTASLNELGTSVFHGCTALESLFNTVEEFFLSIVRAIGDKI